jgi:magnesium transporter
MIRCFISKNSGKGVQEIAKPKAGCWVHLEAPDAEEIAKISEVCDLPEEFVIKALDEEETAHIDAEGDTKLIVIDIPKLSEEENGELATVPLSLFYNDNYIVSVCGAPTSVLLDFFEGRIKNIQTQKQTGLIYQIMYNTSTRFLYYLRQIDKTSDSIQKSLAKSMQNKELMQLLEIQKTLVFFSSSLTANHSVIQRCLVKATGEEKELLEDVLIENRQALEMCSVYREIIKNSMDAFASVVNNNQNTVMKFLTAVTIILSIPMVIAGLWGMNTSVPYEGTLWGFWAVTGVSGVVSAVCAWIMAKKRMF